ncbi:MAG: nucleotidyltransferase [Bacteroidetes bacterium]|nr:MAG: nucleotidyltransferase [Bacteroidota bacterium]
MDKEIRWHQRFENFSKAFQQFKDAYLKYNELSDLEKEGMIQRFEYNFELAWKTLKDYLEAQGSIVKFPREVIKEAFKNEIITDGEIWMEMLDNRNLSVHTYDEAVFLSLTDKIAQKYYKAIEQVYLYLKKNV